MPRKQTRRSVSVKGLTYQRLKGYCDRTGQSLSSFVENLVAEAIGAPTDEDRQKFGETVKASEKVSETKEPAKEPTKVGPEQAKISEETREFNEGYVSPIMQF